MGGAMDLCVGAKHCIVCMEHTAKGATKVVKQCNLPLTGRRCVDLLITDLCVMEMDPSRRRFVLKELAPGVSAEDVRRQTEAEYDVAAKLTTVE